MCSFCGKAFIKKTLLFKWLLCRRGININLPAYALLKDQNQLSIFTAMISITLKVFVWYKKILTGQKVNILLPALLSKQYLQHKIFRMNRITIAFAFSLLLFKNASAQLPALIEKNGRHALLVDGKPYFMLGGQAHNSSAWPALMPAVWRSAQYMHLNTLELPIYWEQVEPTEGKYNFTILDTLLAQARARNMRLVLLWLPPGKMAATIICHPG